MNKIVTLKNGIVRGEKTITDISLNKPNVLALKGLKILDVFQGDVNAFTVLLPRISAPKLLKSEIEAMSLEDFTALSTALFEMLSGEPDENEDEGKSE